MESLTMNTRFTPTSTLPISPHSCLLSGTECLLGARLCPMPFQHPSKPRSTQNLMGPTMPRKYILLGPGILDNIVVGLSAGWCMETMVPRAEPRLACRKMLLTQIRNGFKWGIPATLHLNTSFFLEPGSLAHPAGPAYKLLRA